MEWGVNHLLREAPPTPTRQPSPSTLLPPTHLRTAATAAGPRPPALASYCPQHPGPAGPPIHKYTHTLNAHTHTLTHTPTHTGRNVMASARRRSERAPAGPHPARPPPPLLSAPPWVLLPLLLLPQDSAYFPLARRRLRDLSGPGDLKGRRGLRRKRRELEGGGERAPASCSEVPGPNGGTTRGEG